MKQSDWQRLAAAIGPLRYQTSEADCVPTTVINALLVTYQRTLPTALVKQIWAVGVDFDSGTGWVGTRMLAGLLDIWFKTAVDDHRERTEIALCSRICSEESAHLGPGNVVVRTLNAGGVCCVTVQEGQHYVLLLATHNGDFLAFDPSWNRHYQSPTHQREFFEYCGLVNRRFSREQLTRELDHSYNKHIHIIEHS